MDLKLGVLFTVAVLCFANVLGDNDDHKKLPDPVCLTGIFHKASPSPGGGGFKACQLFRNNSCCTDSFTDMLSGSPIEKVGNFSWLQCGQKKLSRNCEKFMIDIECFYQCSPIVGYWKGKFKGSFEGVPICSAFCDRWFDACKDEMTCAENWITGFNRTTDGSNPCKDPCRNFLTVYKNGRGLCEKMWGQSFKYQVPAKPHDCIHLDFQNYTLADGLKVAAYLKFGSASLARLHGFLLLIVSFTAYLAY